MPLSEIASLQQTLNSAIDAFKAELAAQQLPEPSLNTSKPHATDDIAYLPTPRMYEARRTALASLVCHRTCSRILFFDDILSQGLLKSLIQSPYDALAAGTWSTLEVASVRLAADTGLANILADAPDPEQGLSITELAEKANVDAIKLGTLSLANSYFL